MMLHEHMDLLEIAAVISGTLEAAGIRADLSGGSAVSVYTENKYQSRDLDFVSDADFKAIESALSPLGFYKKKRYLVHDKIEYLVEFPAGPLAVGYKVVKERHILQTPYGPLRVLSPTHCVMDRLSAYFHWNDPQSLRQALLVAAEHEAVNLEEIADWANGEGAEDKFQTFLNALSR